MKCIRRDCGADAEPQSNFCCDHGFGFGGSDTKLLVGPTMNRTPRIHLVEYALLVAIVVPIVLMFCGIWIAYDLHSARLEFAASNTELRRETFRRVDQLLWKADTGLELAGAMRLDLGTMITKLRVQVKQSSDESTKSAKVQTQAATAAVTQAIDTTRQAIEVVAGETETPAESAPPSEQPITVNVPAPVVVTSAKPAESPRIEVNAVKHRRWFTYLWRWW